MYIDRNKKASKTTGIKHLYNTLMFLAFWGSALTGWSLMASQPDRPLTSTHGQLKQTSGIVIDGKLLEMFRKDHTVVWIADVYAIVMEEGNPDDDPTTPPSEPDPAPIVMEEGNPDDDQTTGGSGKASDPNTNVANNRDDFDFGSFGEMVPASLPNLNRSIVDSQGFITLLGTFQKSLLVNDLTYASKGSSNAFIAKFDPDGGLVWLTVIEGTGTVTPSNLHLDEWDNLYVAGTFTERARFGARLLQAKASRDGFVIQLDDLGGINWARRIASMADVSISGLSGSENGDIKIFTSANRFQAPSTSFRLEYNWQGSLISAEERQ